MITNIQRTVHKKTNSKYNILLIYYLKKKSVFYFIWQSFSVAPAKGIEIRNWSLKQVRIREDACGTMGKVMKTNKQFIFRYIDVNITPHLFKKKLVKIPHHLFVSIIRPVCFSSISFDCL